MEFDGGYINYHHIGLLCDRMTCNKKLVSIFRHGINNDNIGPIAKASFEETSEMFLKAARHAELDNMRGVSANVMCGQFGYFGTGACHILLYLQAMEKANTNAATASLKDIHEEAEDILLNKNKDGDDKCSIEKITVSNFLTAANAASVSIGQTVCMNDNYDMGF
jgi:DNA-directed RNA polymerase beta' subunit